MKLLKQRFARALGEHEIELAELALLAVELLAVSSEPGRADAAGTATRRAKEQLRQLVGDARKALPPGPESRLDAESAAAALLGYLGNSLGFAGNRDNYYSASNSNLGWVLAERCGIPITLAIVYIEVGRALGYDVRGIGFPGHFMVGVYVARDVQLIDPFSARLVSREDCMLTLARMQGQGDSNLPVPVDDTLFSPATSRQTILRLLENLKQIHLQARATGPALAALDLQILVAPDSFELRAQHEALVRQMFGRNSGLGDQPELH